MKQQPPLQQIPAKVPLQVIRVDDLDSPASFMPHRHAFYMLFWTTKGLGRHRIAYLEHELFPGRVFFSHQGQVHQVMAYPEEGWIVLFNAALFRSFLERYPGSACLAFFDEFSRRPYVDLDEAAIVLFGQLVPLLAARSQGLAYEAVMADYLSILLYEATRLSKPRPVGALYTQKEAQLRKLKALVERYYRTERTAPFYAAQLGLPARKLNELTLSAYGQYVQELIYERVLSEAERLLGGTGLAIKEITYELGFIDSAHFAFFFKRRKGITASDFRRKLLG